LPLFVSGPQNTTGVFIQDVPPPASITPTGTGVAVVVGQPLWGPANKLTYPTSPAAFDATFAPPGSVRTGSFHLATTRSAWPVLGCVRAIDPAAVASTVNVLQSATTLATITAPYPGTLGNSIVWTIGAAGDGNANHFKLTGSLTGASGTTTEVYDNLNVSGTGANVLPNLANSTLAVTFAFVATGIPTAGNITMSGGTNGTTTAAHYVGTPGGSTFGFSLLESDQTINHVWCDDMGNSFRPTVNAGLFAHVELTTDRVGWINGPSGQSAASAQTDVASYRSLRLVYNDPWVNVNDDTTGASRLIPSGSFGASVAAQTPPSLSIGYRALNGLYSGIISLEADRGSARGQNTAAGISTLIKAPGGGISYEVDCNTSLLSGQTDLTRTRLGQYIGRSVQQSWQPFVNAPNVPFFQQPIIDSLDAFLANLLNNAKINPAALPIISAYALSSIAGTNTPFSISQGQFIVGAQILTSSQMKQIILAMSYGPGLTITVS
jgi:hypothetical protein